MGDEGLWKDRLISISKCARCHHTIDLLGLQQDRQQNADGRKSGDQPPRGS